MKQRPKRLTPKEWRMQRAGVMRRIAGGHYTRRRMRERVPKMTRMQAVAVDIGTAEFRIVELIGGDVRRAGMLLQSGMNAAEVSATTKYSPEFVDFAREVFFGTYTRPERRGSSYEAMMGGAPAKRTASPKTKHKGRNTPRAGAIDGKRARPAPTVHSQPVEESRSSLS